MTVTYFENELYDKVDYSLQNPPEGEYDNCSFTNCIFSNIFISKTNFNKCSFTGCDFSNIKFNNIGLKDVLFIECKLLGVHFNYCNPILFQAEFSKCNLNFSSFYKLKLKKAKFSDNAMNEVDFSECDLTAATFKNCDLTKAIFDQSILEKADFRSAYNFSINPKKNRVKKAKFSLEGAVGLLNTYDLDIEG